MQGGLNACPFCPETTFPEVDLSRGYIAPHTGKHGTAVAVYCPKCLADMSLCREDCPDATPEDLLNVITEKWNSRPESMEAMLCKLADENFKRDLGSRLKKLTEEIGELSEAIVNRDNSATCMEAADCAFVLMDIAHLCGGSLSAAQRQKWEILMQRKRDGMLHKAARIANGH